MRNRESETLAWLRSLSPRVQQYEAANDPVAFIALIEATGDGHGLDGEAVSIARQKAESINRARQAGSGALLWL